MKAWCKVEDPAYEARLRERFSRLHDTGPGCWNWRGSNTGRTGYGQVKVRNRNELAHRVAAQLAGIDVPDGMDVLHRCDNPACVNPAHLFAGTHAENMADKATKLRAPSRLAATDIPAIRARLAAGEGVSSIGRSYGVSHHTISDIRDGVTWAQVGH